MAEVAAVKERVRQILMQRHGEVTEDADGDFKRRTGSTTIFVSVRPWADYDQTIVEVWGFVGRNVPPSPDLFHFVATKTDTFMMGHLGVADNEDGTVNIGMFHRLLGEDLDAEELMAALGGVSGSADELDDEITTRFGGVRFHQD